MQILDVSNLKNIFAFAGELGVTTQEIEDAANELGVVGSMIDDRPYLDKPSRDRIEKYLQLKKAANAARCN